VSVKEFYNFHCLPLLLLFDLHFRKLWKCLNKEHEEHKIDKKIEGVYERGNGFEKK